MIETQQKKQRFILVAVSTDGEQAERSLDELSLLVETAGGEEAGRMVQVLDHPNPGTYVGSGKAEELRAMVSALSADGIVCDDELTPAQTGNLSDLLDAAVLDRTVVILDIFAARARTSEGKIQVELAQLRYRSSRLTGMRKSLSRLGGGIGTRGPGEAKLEIDRRRIHSRIGQLKAELEDVRVHRELTRQQRKKNGLFTVSLAGYTNAGKSTLLNRLTGSDVFAEDKLFATLDPTSRRLILPDGEPVLVTDTVGFISKLPHQLIEAFRGTLEEIRYSDLILHVTDESDPQAAEHMQVVYAALDELGAGSCPVITVLNKCDKKAPDQPRIHDGRAESVLEISAATGEGLDRLIEEIASVRSRSRSPFAGTIPWERTGDLEKLRAAGQILEETYSENGTTVRGFVPRSYEALVRRLQEDRFPPESNTYLSENDQHQKES